MSIAVPMPSKTESKMRLWSGTFQVSLSILLPVSLVVC